VITSAPVLRHAGESALAHQESQQTAALLKIDISVGSRFHAFDLARELSRQQMLRHLHTGYPAPIAQRFGVPRAAVRSVWTGEPLNRALSALYRRGWLHEQPDPYVSQRHDRIVASRLRPGADVFVGWSSQCRESLATADRLGMTAIVERGSAHIEWQRNELLEEARLTGLPVEIPHPRTIEQELAEYSVADFIAVPSAFAARTFVCRGVPAAKLLVNAYGVDLSLFSPDASKQRQQPARANGLRVLHVGRVSAQKGVHYLADAVSRVPRARLTLVGGLDAGIDAALQGRLAITIAGSVPGRSLPGWYSAADVFCLLSVQDGLALVIAQAMAMGLPVIATPNTGAEELIEDGVTGFIVPARDPAAAAARLQQLDEDPELRHEMGRRARARVADGFGWTHYGERARAHYTRIVTARRAARGK
jgi:glycosyltransferase involved in cell wall biosynthesis